MYFKNEVHRFGVAELEANPPVFNRDAFLTTRQVLLGAPALVPAAGVGQLGCVCVLIAPVMHTKICFDRGRELHRAEVPSLVVGHTGTHSLLCHPVSKGRLGAAKRGVQTMPGASYG